MSAPSFSNQYRVRNSATFVIRRPSGKARYCVTIKKTLAVQLFFETVNLLASSKNYCLNILVVEFVPEVDACLINASNL